MYEMINRSEKKRSKYEFRRTSSASETRDGAIIQKHTLEVHIDELIVDTCDLIALAVVRDMDVDISAA